MSGHSKWANIKRTKAKVDEKKGKIFSKMAREIIVAARQGGGNPEANFRLKTAILKAKEYNLPADNIARAIAKGTGEAGGADYEEIVYEGYGPGGVAVLLEIMTDNRNRTASEIRHIFSKNGGNLGETGCVSWMFSRKGLVTVDKEGSPSEEELMLTALEAGAGDLGDEGEVFEVTCPPESLEPVRDALEKAGAKIAGAEITMVPQNYVELRGDEAAKMLKLVDTLEDHDDVQKVHANFDIPDDEMARLEG